MSQVEKIRVIVLVILVIATILGGVLLLFQQNTSSCPIEITLPTPSGQIEVHVSGEVQHPGLYILEENARVTDAIEVAGGFAVDAERTINLARKLRDGAQVHVYKQGESSQRVNINTADAWLLDALPGIGESTAERIIEYRTGTAAFESIEDLTNVKGIGDSTLEKLKDKIAVY